MSIKAVIDTNVLVSAFWTKRLDSPTARIVTALRDGRFVPVYSPEIIAEYREVLNRSQFHFDVSSVNALIDHIVEIGDMAEPADSDEDFPDPDDKVFYCVAMSREDENAMLVTGNARHYPKKPIVISPAAFCELLGV